MSGGGPTQVMNVPQDVSTTNFAICQGSLLIDAKDQTYPYKNGFAPSFKQNVYLGSTCLKAIRNASDTRPNLTTLARKYKVLRGILLKIERDLFVCGEGDGSQKTPVNREYPIGPNSISLCNIDTFVIQMLYH